LTAFSTRITLLEQQDTSLRLEPVDKTDDVQGIAGR
jgi:hypothetical protein